MSEESCSNIVCIDKPASSIIDQKVNSNILYKSTPIENYYPSRPLYRTEIGRMTWRLFHRFSVNCNVNDTEDKKNMENFIIGLSEFFPCPTCKDDFKKEISNNPYDKVLNQSSNDALVNWVCVQHNLVNEKLNKKKFDCNINKIKSEYTF